MLPLKIIYHWLQRRFGWGGPQIKSNYSVFYGDQLLATLSEPIVEDQFWVSFRLIPASANTALLEILYNDELWGSNSWMFKETDTHRSVQFMLQIEIEETADKASLKSVLHSRPERILLRGPYSVSISASRG